MNASRVTRARHRSPSGQPVNLPFYPPAHARLWMLSGTRVKQAMASIVSCVFFFLLLVIPPWSRRHPTILGLPSPAYIRLNRRFPHPRFHHAHPAPYPPRPLYSLKALGIPPRPGITRARQRTSPASLPRRTRCACWAFHGPSAFHSHIIRSPANTRSSPHSAGAFSASSFLFHVRHRLHTSPSGVKSSFVLLVPPSPFSHINIRSNLLPSPCSTSFCRRSPVFPTLYVIL